jgi:hypothetical protein
VEAEAEAVGAIEYWASKACRARHHESNMAAHSGVSERVTHVHGLGHVVKWNSFTPAAFAASCSSPALFLLDAMLLYTQLPAARRGR